MKKLFIVRFSFHLPCWEKVFFMILTFLDVVLFDVIILLMVFDRCCFVYTNMHRSLIKGFCIIFRCHAFFFILLFFIFFKCLVINPSIRGSRAAARVVIWPQHSCYPRLALELYTKVKDLEFPSPTSLFNIAFLFIPPVWTVKSNWGFVVGSDKERCESIVWTSGQKHYSVSASDTTLCFTSSFTQPQAPWLDPGVHEMATMSPSLLRCLQSWRFSDDNNIWWTNGGLHNDIPSTGILCNR